MSAQLVVIMSGRGGAGTGKQAAAASGDDTGQVLLDYRSIRTRAAPRVLYLMS